MTASARHEDGREARRADVTSVHLRRARTGDSESLGWIVEHLTPLLRAQASYRLPARLARYCDPDDLVDEVWAVALPRLGDLHEREGRCTPVLLRFLGTTLLNMVNNLMIKHARECGAAERGDVALERQPAVVTSVVGAAQRSETAALLERALADLADADREVIVLRGIEQLGNDEAARFLGQGSSTVAMRYKRALAKLRQKVPASIFEELTE